MLQGLPHELHFSTKFTHWLPSFSGLFFPYTLYFARRVRDRDNDTGPKHYSPRCS
jgi:hypothetical protein